MLLFISHKNNSIVCVSTPSPCPQSTVVRPLCKNGRQVMEIFFSASFLNHCLAALNFVADVEQPFDSLIAQNRQAMQSVGRSMDWTLEKQHGRRFVLLRHTHRPQMRPCTICTSRSWNVRHRYGKMSIFLFSPKQKDVHFFIFVPGLLLGVFQCNHEIFVQPHYFLSQNIKGQEILCPHLSKSGEFCTPCPLNLVLFIFFYDNHAVVSGPYPWVASISPS